MQNKETNKKALLINGIISFLKFVLISIIYLIILGCGMVFFNSYSFGYGISFIAFYLICTVIGIVYYSKTTTLLELFQHISYLVLSILGLVACIIAFLTLGWLMAGLSATTIIIILLVLIYLK